MNRETIKFITPVGKNEIEIKSWLTGGEKRNITNSLLDDVNFSTNDVENFTLKSEMINKSQDKTFEVAIVGINGKNEDIVKTVLDMRSEDFDFIVKEINKVTGNETEEKVKKS